MNELKHRFLLNVKAIYKSDELSDGTINIIENKSFISDKCMIPEEEAPEPEKGNKIFAVENQFDQKVEVSNYAQEKLFCSLPIHCFVLSLQSDYFKNLMYNSNMMESNTKVFNMKVGEGEGVYMQYLIQSFYDMDIFNELECYSLVRVLQLADRYSCNSIIEHMRTIIKSVKLSGIENCDNIAQQINIMKCGFETSMKIQEKIFHRCGVSAAKYFCPLEEQTFENHKLFQQLSFDLLVAMLRCKQPIAWHENSVLYYIELWLKFDPARQTEDNIRCLLEATNYFSIESDFLMDVITENHEIFNKWNQFKDWYIYAVGNQSFNRKRSCFSLFGRKYNRNYDRPNAYTCYSFLMQRQGDNSFKPKEQFFVNEGYRLIPCIIFKEHSTKFYKVILDFLTYLNVQKKSLEANDDGSDNDSDTDEDDDDEDDDMDQDHEDEDDDETEEVDVEHDADDDENDDTVIDIQFAGTFYSNQASKLHKFKSKGTSQNTFMFNERLKVSDIHNKKTYNIGEIAKDLADQLNEYSLKVDFYEDQSVSSLVQITKF